MKSILILQDMPLYEYRAYIYNELVSRGFEVCVISIVKHGITPPTNTVRCSFNHIVLQYINIGPFIHIKGFKYSILDNYDVIIVDPNVRILAYNKILRNKKLRNKIVAWGHMKGRTVGNGLAQKYRLSLLRNLKSLVFYDELTRREFISLGFDSSKLFTANNTQYVDNSNIDLNKEKKYFLFVGRMQNRKRIDMLIEAFSIVNKTFKNISLYIVGGGDQNKYKELVKSLELESSVIFKGNTRNENELKDIFESAIAYVSPGHVGLGVLHSLAFGVPVITCDLSTHAPEVCNCNEDNSMIVSFSTEAVANAMMQLCSDKSLLKQKSIAAYNYYNQNCTLQIMVDGIHNAIKNL